MEQPEGSGRRRWARSNLLSAAVEAREAGVSFRDWVDRVADQADLDDVSNKDLDTIFEMVWENGFVWRRHGKEG